MNTSDRLLDHLTCYRSFSDQDMCKRFSFFSRSTSCETVLLLLVLVVVGLASYTWKGEESSVINTKRIIRLLAEDELKKMTAYNDCHHTNSKFP